MGEKNRGTDRQRETERDRERERKKDSEAERERESLFVLPYPVGFVVYVSDYHRSHCPLYKLS